MYKEWWKERDNEEHAWSQHKVLGGIPFHYWEWGNGDEMDKWSGHRLSVTLLNAKVYTNGVQGMVEGKI